MRSCPGSIWPTRRAAIRPSGNFARRSVVADEPSTSLARLVHWATEQADLPDEVTASRMTRDDRLPARLERLRKMRQRLALCGRGTTRPPELRIWERALAALHIGCERDGAIQ